MLAYLCLNNKTLTLTLKSTTFYLQEYGIAGQIIEGCDGYKVHKLSFVKCLSFVRIQFAAYTNKCQSKIQQIKKSLAKKKQI